MYLYLWELFEASGQMAHEYNDKDDPLTEGDEEE